jgi:hypothetical protein
MRRKTKVGASPKNEGLTKQYGQIGISAVAAAVRYQPNDKSTKPPKAKRPDDPTIEARSLPRGTSPRR